jgi:serine/threonine protein kinase
MKQRNIVQFFRAFSYKECTYLVLELCPNGSLMDMVKRRKGLTEPEVRFYSMQVAGAIKYMHSKGIIHRDLKMGNIFLDRQMNAKVGDFGLAALVVTGKDMQTIRRTTLCGTPNYIAPEILEKGRQGHDHMVDIWSLGIIMFAMLTSKPPFQSTSTDEIYRRAKERDYEWPVPETTNKYISAEAKDLVATMLEDADRRPEPDDIVQHPFFTCGYMPTEAEITTKLLTLPPDDACFWASRLTPELQTATMKNFRAASKDCAVGPYANQQLNHIQTWKEMAAEEKAGLTPVIPLADDIVYRPFDEWLKEKQQNPAGVAGHSTLRAKPETQLLASQTAPTGLMRAPPQSFAAQQRAQGRPAAPASSTRARPASEAVPTTTQVPVRPKTVRQYTATEPLVEAPEEPVPRKTSVRRAPLPKSQSASAVPTTQDMLPSSASGDTMRSSSTKSINSTTLFSPSETPEPIVDSQPDAILERLRRLQAELERALNARTMAIISAKDKAPAHPQVVVKWVDYTNKFGLGYILNDGGVGCILRDIPTADSGKTATLPSACMLVRNAERHIERRQDETYPDRHQPIPPKEDIHFFENNGEAGLNWVGVPARKFRVPIAEDGTPGKLNAGKDVYEHRKRERVILWKKFANYMIAYGRDEMVLAEENATQPAKPTDASTQPSDLVTFYQRFGDVGCWVFCDGHLQVRASSTSEKESPR